MDLNRLKDEVVDVAFGGEAKTYTREAIQKAIDTCFANGMSGTDSATLIFSLIYAVKSEYGE